MQTIFQSRHSLENTLDAIRALKPGEDISDFLDRYTFLRWTVTRTAQNYEYHEWRDWQFRDKQGAKVIFDCEGIGSRDYIPTTEEFLRGVDTETWANWDELFTVLSNPDQHTDWRHPLNFRGDFMKLEVLLVASMKGFNTLRHRFSDERYRDGWNVFFRTTAKVGLGSKVFIELARGTGIYLGLDLRHVTVNGVTEFALFQEADLRGATIRGTAKNNDWRGADLRNATFDHTSFEGEHNFTGVDLSQTRFHECKASHSFTAFGLPESILSSLRP
jgi:hypothetical protein